MPFVHFTIDSYAVDLKPMDDDYDSPGVKLANSPSYQNLSPNLSLANWSPKMHSSVGPILAPGEGISVKAPVNRSISSGYLES